MSAQEIVLFESSDGAVTLPVEVDISREEICSSFSLIDVSREEICSSFSLTDALRAVIRASISEASDEMVLIRDS